MDHGWGAQRHRPGRSEEPRSLHVPPPPSGVRQPEYRGVRRGGDPVVHGPERRLRQRGSPDGEGTGLRRAARDGPIRDGGGARRDCVARIAGGQLHRPHQPSRRRTGRGGRPDAGRRRPADLERFPRLPMGHRVGRGNARSVRPFSRSWSEWRLPGENPQPYAVYVDERDVVWITDFGANALVRFTPRTERFRAFPFPSRGAEVRQLLGRSGEVWGAESGTDKLVVLRTR